MCLSFADETGQQPCSYNHGGACNESSDNAVCDRNGCAGDMMRFAWEYVGRVESESRGERMTMLEAVEDAEDVRFDLQNLIS